MLLGQEGTAPALLRSRTLESLKDLPYVDYALDTAKTAEVTCHDQREHVTIHTAAGHTIVARRLIIATGQRDVCEQVDGLAEAFGRYAFHCPYCHGFEASGKDILVLAIPGVPIAKAIFQALYLKNRFSSSVRLLAPERDITGDFAKLLATSSIDVVDGEAKTVTGSLGEVSVITKDETTLRCELAFATPPTESAAKELIESLDLNTRGACIMTDDHGRTSCHLVFAAGDVTVSPEEQEPMTFVSQAVAEGQRTAVWVDQDLFMESLGMTDPPQIAPSDES
jgi:FAD-dependent pyridine nucleotide-disulphide oxidoreductase